MTISNRTLIKIAAWGGVIVSTTGFYLQFKLIDNVRSHDYYKCALKALRAHAGAVHYLGQPIKDRRFKLTDKENNFTDANNARFCVPVKGPKDKENTRVKMFIGNAKEKFIYHNTLLCLVQGLQGNNVTLDLRNDAFVCGKIESVDGFMNISFVNAVYCDTHGNEFSFENLYVQARNIRYVHIPESMPIISTIKNEVCRKKSARPTTKKLAENSRKMKKALKQHMDVVASLDTD